MKCRQLGRVNSEMVVSLARLSIPESLQVLEGIVIQLPWLLKRGDIDEISSTYFPQVSLIQVSASSSTVHSGLYLKKMTAASRKKWKFQVSRQLARATSDFVLVAENGVAMTCHRNFLEAHCPSFEIAFANQSTPIQHRLNLSEEGLKALPRLRYCLEVDIPREKPSVALELLDIGHQKANANAPRRP
ncbi:hypothetical protein Ocin01_19681, partial [Orchesella cincta]